MYPGSGIAAIVNNLWNYTHTVYFVDEAGQLAYVTNDNNRWSLSTSYRESDTVPLLLTGSLESTMYYTSASTAQKIMPKGALGAANVPKRVSDADYSDIRVYGIDSQKQVLARSKAYADNFRATYSDR